MLLLERVADLCTAVEPGVDRGDAKHYEDDAGDEAAVFHEGLHLELLGVVGGSERGAVSDYESTSPRASIPPEEVPGVA